MKHITLGVAGHIDHGKTALVRALTGMETDRLAEEQERGMSIVLGFAHLQTPEGEIDLIDAPGHERFVHTMIAGATGIEAVLLAVAANEIVMPQTREHVALTELLGVRKGLVVLTKSDLVPDPDERARVEQETRVFLSRTFLHDAPLLWASAATGEGLDDLHAALRRILQSSEPLPPLPQFYLPIDRAFTLTGHGTVVTGTLRRGALCVGQSVEIAPGGARAMVRGLEVHGRAMTQAEPGWRTAVNLRGVKRDDVRRGDALASPDTLRATRLLDVELRLLPDAPPLRRGQSVRLHYGTADALARVHPMEGETIEPGQAALAQLRLADEIRVPVHERFVIRALSPALTLGGGLIVDASPTRHRQRDTEAAGRVRTLSAGDTAARVQAKLAEACEVGLPVARLPADLGVTEAQVAQALAELPVVQIAGLAVLREFFDDLASRAAEQIHQYHAKHPTQRGMPREDLRRRLPPHLPVPLFGLIVETLVQQGQVAAEDGLLREASFSPDARLSLVERAIVREIEARFQRAGLKPPDPQEVIGADRRRKNLYHFLRESGRLVETTDRFSGRIVTFHADAIAEAARRLESALADGKGATVSEINSMLGITRKYAIPLLEYFDARGLTKRIGDARIWIAEKENAHA